MTKSRNEVWYSQLGNGIFDIVQGPRMALIIDPGDGAYPDKFSLATQTDAVGGPAAMPATT